MVEEAAGGGAEGAVDVVQCRADVRAWLADHVPTGWQERLTGAGDEEFVEFQRWWLGELRAGGYAAPHWPEEFGGGGFSLAEQVVIQEEMAQAGAPQPNLFMVSLTHAAATLMAHGNAEQQRHLSAILDGEVWCQGFSEPDAGSDLAGLTTRAERHGDTYVVNGQKVWSSMAMFADWCLLLARTDPEAPKHKGISYFLLDMRTPGVEIRRIRQMTGEAEFCEVFLNDVVVPAGNLLGDEGAGWAIAQTTLSSERGTGILGLQRRLSRSLGWIVDEAAARGQLGDTSVRQALARNYAEVEILRLLGERMFATLLRTGDVGPESSVVKLYYSELLQRLTELGVQLEGLPSHLARSRLTNEQWSSGVWLVDHLASWAWTIAGGTNQIQRNVIGERVLGLPREPAPA